MGQEVADDGTLCVGFMSVEVCACVYVRLMYVDRRS